jgi:hypothetical protein
MASSVHSVYYLIYLDIDHWINFFGFCTFASVWRSKSQLYTEMPGFQRLTNPTTDTMLLDVCTSDEVVIYIHPFHFSGAIGQQALEERGCL